MTATAHEEARRATWTFRDVVEDFEATVEDAGGEVTPSAACLEALAEQEGEYAIEQWALAYREFKATEARGKALKEEYAKKERRAKEMALKCKEEIQLILLSLEKKRVRLSDGGSVSLSQGREVVEIDESDETVLDRLHALCLAERKTVPDKREIARLLKEGRPIPGCRMVRGKTGVTIR